MIVKHNTKREITDMCFACLPILSIVTRTTHFLDADMLYFPTRSS